MGVHYTIRELSTGKTVARTWNTGEMACWRTVEPVIAEWFGVPVDEIEIGDNAESGDFLVVNGVRVAEIVVQYDRPQLREAAPLAPRAQPLQAAE